MNIEDNPIRIHHLIIRICVEYPDGICEMKLRELVKNEVGYKNDRSVKTHLNTLNILGVISKKKNWGKANEWIFNLSGFVDYARSEMDMYTKCVDELNLLIDHVDSRMNVGVDHD